MARLSSDTDEMIEQLDDLIQLDHDAVQAYSQAIQRLDAEDLAVRHELESFRADHERHITDLQNAIRALGGEPREISRDLKGALLEGFTALRSATGTLGALKAMQTNEKHTNKAYSRAADVRLPLVARDVVARNFDDERRHLAAIKAHIARIDQTAVDVDEVDVEDERDLLPDDQTGAPI